MDLEKCRRCNKTFKALLRHIALSKTNCEEAYGEDELNAMKTESRKRSKSLYNDANREKINKKQKTGPINHKKKHMIIKQIITS